MRLRGAVLLVVSVIALAHGAPASAAVDLPEVNLRGFGKVSGHLEYSQPAGTTQSGSILTLTCEDAGKARLTLAKHLSDAQELPGLSKTELKAGQWGWGSVQFGGNAFSAYEVKDQGWIAGLRRGNKVLLAASPTCDGLVAEINGALTGDKSPVVSQAEVEVPMWLDRYDKHGFRFYYWAGLKPTGQNDKPYDFRQDFQFAHDHNVGIVLWNPLSLVMGADGQTDLTSWDWAEGFAKNLNVPVAINLSALNYDIPSWMANRYRDQKVDPNTQDMLIWKDGTVAAGMRKIGKGVIIEMGCKSNGQPWLGIAHEAILPILKWAGVTMNPIDVTLDKPAKVLRDYTFRHYVSNNGLDDLSVIWNNTSAPIKTTINFKEASPATARDALTGQELPVQGGKLADLAVEPNQTRIFITPRGQIADAALDWFNLQSGWWRAAIPITKPFPKLSDRFVRDLNENWSWHPVADKEDTGPEIAASFDDSSWPKIPVGSWTADPKKADVKHAIMRRSFTVPAEWNGAASNSGWSATATNSRRAPRSGSTAS